MRARIVTADRAHIPVLAAFMRQADRDECWAWAQATPMEALAFSFESSRVAWTGLLDGEPVCMFGASADGWLSRQASPWLLATDGFDAVPVTAARLSREALARIVRLWPVLANWTDARNLRAHAWLRWLGFSLGAPRPMGAQGLDFIPFSMGGT